MSGGLPPRTAVSTFCSVSSLLTYRRLTFWPGCGCSYSATRCGEGLGLGAGLALPDLDRSLLPLDPLPLLSVPQPASTSDGRRRARPSRTCHGTSSAPGWQRLGHTASPLEDRSSVLKARVIESALCIQISVSDARSCAKSGANETLASCDQGDVHRGRQRRVHPERGDRPVQLPGAARPSCTSRCTTSAPSGWPTPSGWPAGSSAQTGAGATVTATQDRRAGAGRRRLRDQRGAGGRVRRHPGRLRHPGPVRGAPDDRGHPRHRRHLPRPADHPGRGGAGAGTCSRYARTPTCSATATRWPCCPGRSTRAPGSSRVYGLCHSVRDTQAFLTELVGADPDRVELPHRGLQPPGVRAALRAGRRVPVPAAGRGHRAVARAAAPGPGGDLPPVRLLPDRVQRALRRVRALVHAPRRPDRAVPHLRRRLPGAVGGEPARAGRRCSASWTRASRWT